MSYNIGFLDASLTATSCNSNLAHRAMAIRQTRTFRPSYRASQTDKSHACLLEEIPKMAKCGARTKSGKPCRSPATSGPRRPDVNRRRSREPNGSCLHPVEPDMRAFVRDSGFDPQADMARDGTDRNPAMQQSCGAIVLSLSQGLGRRCRCVGFRTIQDCPKDLRAAS
jgi:hypothetical protein